MSDEPNYSVRVVQKADGTRAWEEGDQASELPSSTGSLTVELEKLKAENERLKDAAFRCMSGWHRLMQFIVVCNGSTDACRFWDLSKKHKGVDVFIHYITSLWNEIDKRKSENA